MLLDEEVGFGGLGVGGVGEPHLGVEVSFLRLLSCDTGKATYDSAIFSDEERNWDASAIDDC